MKSEGVVAWLLLSCSSLPFALLDSTFVLREERVKSVASRPHMQTGRPTRVDDF